MTSLRGDETTGGHHVDGRVQMAAGGFLFVAVFLSVHGSDVLTVLMAGFCAAPWEARWPG